MRNVGVDVERLKAVLAAEISGALARGRLSVRQAQVKTGIAAADFSRIRGNDLKRFTVDRLMSIINRLGARVEVAVKLAQVEGDTVESLTLVVPIEPPTSLDRTDPQTSEIAALSVGASAAQPAGAQ